MSGMRTVIAGIFMVVVVFAASLAPSQEQKVYTFGVVPQATPAVVFTSWNPLLKKLGNELGVKIELRMYDDIPKFETSFLASELDFAFMNPYHVVMARKSGYTPLVKDKEPLVGILVVKKGGSIRDIKDLEGKTIAFPAPNAFAASLYMRALLKEHSKLNFKPMYLGNHSNTYRSVLTESMSVMAGGGVKKTLNKETENVKDGLAVLYETPPAASHPIMSHSRVPEEVRRSFVDALMKIARTDKDLLAAIQMSDPQVANYEKDYAPLKELGLERYVVASEK